MDWCHRENVLFPTGYTEIIERVRAIDPVKYGATRNYINGSVTYLSPYISRGIVSTKFILSQILNRGYKPAQIEKFIQELAWRDYWQQVWISKGNAINYDLKHEQKPVSNTSIAKVIVEANMGIEAIDNALYTFYKTGYLHNHLRMYIASIACNIGQSHWKVPAQWMYYHLLDADWASNALSWQWVAGTNANKKYVANQDNINKYCFTQQKHTFLDVPYDAFSSLEIPEILKNTSEVELKTPLPKQKIIVIDEALPTCIYNFYNLDPLWKKERLANRILILEPSHFEEYPISQNTIDFIITFSEENIANIQIYIGEFNTLITTYNFGNIFYKEHPLNKHYKGIEEPREWLFNVEGYYPSFFAFWKQCKKQLTY
ncbi:deoxyribodipyrimidine photolyase [Bizionia gelidisalsuginis]|uniref:Deoxyribodipyrimidine photolyase n=1 Tax=Bizionia gelidisalsuginis TaxID=291188 RepID=A0ABY3MD61_9FLAO|nr:FAD-binding domain-containing protein [Bizionia gelidisalsuginis]TYC16284.1 deoxyribodipyrimidine photolyase [Bizionia gelidisalsuginis]